ncbi:MAG: aldehyde dehydrogenase family protein, partial [Pseudomonadota bacterium]
FIEACKVAVAAMLPTFEVGSDLTSQIHTRQFDRLVELLETSGTEPIHLHPQGKLNREDRLFPPIALKNPNLNAAVMTEEIFGPILPVIGVENLDHALSIIAKRDHPLALYYFGTDKSEQARIEADTTAGGITINDTILHISQDTLPFGGVGASGIGRYHGKHGFDEFSHIKSVLHASRSRLAELHFPPYRVALRWLLKTRL